jgi:hypothetical protein
MHCSRVLSSHGMIEDAEALERVITHSMNHDRVAKAFRHHFGPLRTSGFLNLWLGNMLAPFFCGSGVLPYGSSQIWVFRTYIRLSLVLFFVPGYPLRRRFKLERRIVAWVWVGATSRPQHVVCIP